uniref:Uncharacterized protein n=1 Tax=Romanomermis culicivorax TaxID=13658 RepID=A0A915LA57_ROMCU
MKQPAVSQVTDEGDVCLHLTNWLPLKNQLLPLLLPGQALMSVKAKIYLNITLFNVDPSSTGRYARHGHVFTNPAFEPTIFIRTRTALENKYINQDENDDTIRNQSAHISNDFDIDDGTG